MKLYIRYLTILIFFFTAGCGAAEASEPINRTRITPPPEVVAGGGNANVEFVSAEQLDDDSWSFAVTVSHPDTGWDDYADGWDVVLQDGTVLKPDSSSPFTRLLLHPHVDEQPFTRSQSGIVIPEDEGYVIVRAHDLVDGFGGQSVVVDLSSAGGELYQVIRHVSTQVGVLGLTNHHLNGNRFLTGRMDLINTIPQDIPLNGIPEWVVGVPLFDGEAIWLVALQDGALQAFQITQEGYAELALPYSALEAGEPPAIRSTETGFDLLNQLVDSRSKSTHPIFAVGEQLVYISEQGQLETQSGDQVSTVFENPLPDGRILSDEFGNLLLLTEPTFDYSHGVLGDGLEARSFSLVINTADKPQVQTFGVPAGQVIEGLAPIWTDLDGDGVREIIVTLSDAQNGARLAVFSPQGEIISQSDPIGNGYRWRHQIAVAPFGPNGELEIVDVLTPHIGGVVEFFQMQGEKLVKVGTVSGYTSHVIGSRNLDMAVAADVDADGQVELLLPSQWLNSLAAIRRTADGAEAAWEFGLNATMTTNLGAISFVDGSLSLAVGLDSGVLRVWLP
jgi:hypothetical protein